MAAGKTSNKFWWEKWFTTADEAQAAGCKIGMNKFKAYAMRVSGKGKKVPAKVVVG